ncbi:MAG: Unknown protein [uncultured Sulfurovum sp.]|uniref:DUF945 domain-containing protein n=1 Tax=uncultured Sulfurovum sp. TaxID=269237 RepID=A0A6S6TNN7_9BACT|nr:MAG: Unknown protein [uncultured Sulfurovum sp.]
MSATKKIVGSLVAATALWLGGTAYVSSNTEGYLKNYVDKTNSLYTQNGMKLIIEKFDKGFFSSDAKLKIDFVEPTLRQVVAETLKLPIDINYTIENGPLFFKNGLGMGMSRIDNNMKVSDYLVDKEAFLKMFNDDVLLESSTTIDFFKNASFSAISNKIVANVDEDKMYITPLKMNGDFNVKTFQGKVQMLVDSVTSENEIAGINAKNIVLDADITKFFDNGFYLGDFAFDVGSLSIKSKNLPFVLDEAIIHMDMNINENEDKTIDMQFKVDADTGKSKLPEDYSSLKKVELAYALNGTKLEGLLAFQDFSKRLQTRQQELMLKLTSPKTGEMDMKALQEFENFEKDMQGDMMLMLAGLLKKDSSNLAVEMKMLDKKDKESTLNMKFAYVGDEALPTTAKELEEKFTKDFLNLLAVDINIGLDKEYIANLPERFKQELSGQLQVGAMFGVVKDNNTSYNLDVNYKPKVLTVNGQDRTEMLQMLELGLPQ